MGIQTINQYLPSSEQKSLRKREQEIEEWQTEVEYWEDFYHQLRMEESLFEWPEQFNDSDNTIDFNPSSFNCDFSNEGKNPGIDLYTCTRNNCILKMLSVQLFIHYVSSLHTTHPFK